MPRQRTDWDAIARTLSQKPFAWHVVAETSHDYTTGVREALSMRGAHFEVRSRRSEAGGWTIEARWAAGKADLTFHVQGPTDYPALAEQIRNAKGEWLPINRKVSRARISQIKQRLRQEDPNIQVTARATLTPGKVDGYAYYLTTPKETKR